MDSSILNNTKKILGIGSGDASFDDDLIIHINSAFSILHQLGVGPENGFMIEDESATWTDFVPDTEPYFSLVKTCVYLRVRLNFDPPTTSYLLAACQQQLQEHEWRLSVFREGEDWVDPDPEPSKEDELNELIETVASQVIN